MNKWIAFTVLAVLVAACAPVIPGNGGGTPTPVEITAVVSTIVAETPGPPPTEGPSPTPEPATAIPTLASSTLTPTELKYRVLERFPDFFFCDPDLYPVARDNEMVLAKARFAEIQANQEEFETILRHTSLSGTNVFTDVQKLLIYREHKKLSAIFFQLTEDKYQFQIQTGNEGQQGSVITGNIDASGTIEIQNEESSFPSCPICLAKGALIDTPRGPVAVENLRAGDLVWTLNESGERVPGKILKWGSTRAPLDHEVIHLLLSDGREVWASPGHPTADGRLLGDLQVNDSLDGGGVVLVERLPYLGTFTYDLLPSGGTGLYWANGVLLGSTLSEP